MIASKWPVTPRPGQREAAEQLAESLAGGKRVLFSAPTGWGKTITVIAALVKVRFFPAVWFIRALTVGRRVAEDAALWGLTSFIAGGRERTCLLKGSVKDVNDFCKYFRYKCPYARLPSRAPEATNFEELLTEGQRGGWCPYYAQDLMSAEILIQNYFKRIKPVRAPRAFIYDEAHNLLLPKEKSYSISRIVEAVTLAREMGGSERLLRGLESTVRYMMVRDGPLDVSLYLDDELLNELWKLHLQVVERGASLRPLIELASSIAYIEGEKVTTYTPQLPTLYRPAVLVSATLPPGSETLLHVDASIRVPWEVKPTCTVVPDVTTRYEEFDAKMALKYRKLLVEIIRKFRRVLVFVPGERVARELRGITNYEDCEPPEGWQGAVLLRARGRYSEGINLPADAVVIAGAPYLPPSVGEWIAKQLKKAGVPDPVKVALDTPMLISTLQCVGRAWRDPRKPPYVVLADYRFERYGTVLREFFTLEWTQYHTIGPGGGD